MDKREIHEEKARAKLHELNARIDLFQAKLEQGQVEARQDVHKQVDELSRKRENLKMRIQLAQTAGEEAWEDVSEGLEDALDDVQHALDKAGKKIKMAL
jgi:hypothetical protein